MCVETENRKAGDLLKQILGWEIREPLFAGDCKDVKQKSWAADSCLDIGASITQQTAVFTAERVNMRPSECELIHNKPSQIKQKKKKKGRVKCLVNLPDWLLRKVTIETAQPSV